MVAAKVKAAVELDALVEIPVEKPKRVRKKSVAAPAEGAESAEPTEEQIASAKETTAKREAKEAADKAIIEKDRENGVAFLPRGTILHKNFPPGSIASSRSYDVDVLIAELPPAIRTINTYDPARYGWGSRGGPEEGKETFYVAMPWQYFVYVGYTDRSYSGGGTSISLHVFWSKHRIKHLDDPLINGRIPDSENGHICLGNTQAKVYQKPFLEQVEWSLSNFFGHSTFTNLHTGGYNFPRDYSSLAAWQKDSEKNPLCYLKWKEWTANKGTKTLRQFVTNPTRGYW